MVCFYLQAVVKANEFNEQDKEHLYLFRCMLMTGCDIGAISKPWEMQRIVADVGGCYVIFFYSIQAVYEEFFEQGDREKVIGHTPQAILDRSKAAELPKMQVRFSKNYFLSRQRRLGSSISSVLPCTRCSAHSFPALASCQKEPSRIECCGPLYKKKSTKWPNTGQVMRMQSPCRSPRQKPLTSRVKRV
jgi:hypothetical protein